MILPLCYADSMTPVSAETVQRLVTRQEKKWKDNFPVHDCTQEQNGSLYFFFHRSAMQIAVSVEKDLWDPDILRPRYYLTSHFSTLFSVIRHDLAYWLPLTSKLTVSSFGLQGIYAKLFLFSERTMLHSHEAIQKFKLMISACGAVFCNCLNYQLSASFQ